MEPLAQCPARRQPSDRVSGHVYFHCHGHCPSFLPVLITLAMWLDGGSGVPLRLQTTHESLGDLVIRRSLTQEVSEVGPELPRLSQAPR